jgi:type II secretion system protein N
MARGRPARSLGASGSRSVAWGAAGLLLTAFFVVQGFPYERLAAAISAAVGRATPLALQIQELGPSLSILGPGVRATSVRITAPDGVGIRLEALRLRPAWSFRWLLLRPCFRIAAELAGGSVDGTLGGEPSFSGEIAEIDLAQLPVAAFWPGAALTGQIDASVDLRTSAQGPAGAISLAAREGSVTLPRLPLPLPFATLTARLALGGDVMLRVEALQLSGPGLDARVEGQLGLAVDLAEAPLDLRVELEVEPGLAAGLRSLGIRLGRDGRGTLHITGTPARPVVE